MNKLHMNKLHIEMIVNLSNKYKIRPDRILNIYNDYIDRPYTEDKWHALALTERLVRIHFPVREHYGRWKAYNNITFEKRRLI